MQFVPPPNRSVELWTIMEEVSTVTPNIKDSPVQKAKRTAIFDIYKDMNITKVRYNYVKVDDLGTFPTWANFLGFFIQCNDRWI